MVAHCNACLLALLRRFPAAGPFSISAGGNGFVAAALQAEGGIPIILVEPGADGVRHAQARGLHTVVHATMKEARFRDGSLPAIGLFDVLEHIDDELEFLSEIRCCLAADGRITSLCRQDDGYGQTLMFKPDISVGTRASLKHALRRAGFRPLIVSKVFSILPVPLFFCRSLPSLFGRRQLPSKSYSNQHEPTGRTHLERVWLWELS